MVGKGTEGKSDTIRQIFAGESVIFGCRRHARRRLSRLKLFQPQETKFLAVEERKEQEREKGDVDKPQDRQEFK